MSRSIKNYINYILGVLLFFVTVGIVASSYIVWFVLPRGTGMHGSYFCNNWGYGVGGNQLFILGWPRYTWIEIHSWLGVAMAAILLVHIIWHWQWIVEITKRARSSIMEYKTKVKEFYITAVVLFLLFAFEVLSGCVTWLILPRGSLDYWSMVVGSGRTFWGLQRNVWADLHGWVAITIAAIILIHLILNWRWVVAITKNIYRGVYGSFARLLAFER